jgi:hypothetical protein
MSTNDVWH